MERLWKSATSVSNAGKKRGRGGKAAKRLTRDLNRGQIIGQGRKKIIMPGLNSSVFTQNSVSQIERGQDNPEWYVMRDANSSHTLLKCVFLCMISGKQRYSSNAMSRETVKNVFNKFQVNEAIRAEPCLAKLSGHQNQSAISNSMDSTRASLNSKLST